MSCATLSSNYLAKRTTDELIAARDRVESILDFRARQYGLFEPSPRLAAAAVVEPARQVEECSGYVPDVLSPSSVNCFIDCSARWFYRKVLQLPEARTGALALGSAVHEAVAVNYRDKIETGEDLPLAAVVSVFHDSLARQLEENVTLDDGETPEELHGCGHALVDLYMERAAPFIHPVAVELPVEGEIGGVKVHGVVDVLDRDGVVIDLKTASKKPVGVRPADRLQVSTYSMIAPGACGRGQVDTLTKTKTAAHYSQAFEVTAADKKLTERLYSITLDQMRGGLVAPNRSSFLCSQAKCSFHARCVEDYGGEVVA